MGATTHNEEIKRTKLEFIIQHVDFVQTTHRLCGELDFLHVQKNRKYNRRIFKLLL